MATQLSIINTALVLVGAETIASLEDSSREARVAGLVYDVTRDDILTRHLWVHTLGQAQLAELVATPLFGYSRAYQLPTDPKMLRLVRKNQPRNDYEIFEDKLYTDDSAVEIIYQFDPGESSDPAYLVRSMEYEFAKIFALSLLQDETQSQIFDRMAERQLKVARRLDSQNIPPKQIDDSEFVLTAVR